MYRTLAFDLREHVCLPLPQQEGEAEQPKTNLVSMFFYQSERRYLFLLICWYKEVVATIPEQIRVIKSCQKSRCRAAWPTARVMHLFL